MKDREDVLFLCQYFYPEYVSSATLPYDTARALAKAGFSVSALCGYPGEYYEGGAVPLKETHDGIRICRLKYLQLNRHYVFGRLINFFSFTFAVFLRFLHLKNYKSIIVYSNPPILPLIAAWASKIFKTKVIFVSYDVYPEIAYITGSIARYGLISKLMQSANRTIFKNVNRVVALSNEMREYLIKHREQLDPSQVVVIPNWYEDNKMEEVASSYQNKKFQSLNPNENLIVSYFGNLGICQDLDTMLDAIRNLKYDATIKFMFAGHGNKMDELKKVIKQETLSNTMVFDFLHGQDFQDALNVSGVFIVCLAKGLTGLAVPSKTYSYMMAGKPVIAIMGMDSDIAKDLLENTAGYVMEVGEIDKLVAAIKELNNNKQLRIEMGLNVNKIFKDKYTAKKCTSLYIDMMRDVLGER